MDYIFKKQKPITNLNDFVTGVGQGGKDRKFRVRALLKCTNFDDDRKKVINARLPEQKKRNLPFKNEHKHKKIRKKQTVRLYKR